LFVTHDQIEALTMADRIGVLNEGRLIQVGTPVDIYDRPATTFVAQLVGTPRINLLPAGRENGTIHVDESLLQMPAPEGRTLPDKLLVGIRPEDISLNPTGQFNGTVVLTEPLGVETIVHVQSGERTLLSLAPGMIHLQRGADIRFNLLQDRLHFFDETGKRIA
ncbi:MAG: TOBE domain-containing protein, partial [Anaerolineae bacterium]|nr:TOBE domain-containing protein [Anaerolineae bacterium]MCB0246075.1 TOBE domain-containing protein [Anaerolineae bacterium]